MYPFPLLIVRWHPALGLLFLGLAISTGCTSIPRPPASNEWNITSERAASLVRDAQARLIDTRSAEERSGRRIAGSIPIQFGQDQWSPTVSEYEANRFLALIFSAGIQKDELIITICNAGVRAQAAAAYLRSIGFANVYSVSGGYIGNDRDVGWQFAQ